MSGVVYVCECIIPFLFAAGKETTDDELEEMLEGGNAAVFTAGVVSFMSICLPVSVYPS